MKHNRENQAVNRGTLKDLLDQASSLELFHLSMVIQRLLDDPKRIIEVRRRLHIGQTVEFLDVGNPSFELTTVQGRVVALSNTQVTVLETGTRRQWKLPYAAIQLSDNDSSMPGESGQSDTDQDHSASPHQPARPTRDDFRVGDRVSFEDQYLRVHIGTVIRINQKTATLDCGDSQWRVAFSFLRQVHDV